MLLKIQRHTVVYPRDDKSFVNPLIERIGLTRRVYSTLY